MTPQERAIKLWNEEHEIMLSSNPNDYIKLYKKHLEHARSEALEDAAKVAELNKSKPIYSSITITTETYDAWQNCCTKIAKEIHDLKRKTND